MKNIKNFDQLHESGSNDGSKVRKAFNEVYANMVMLRAMFDKGMLNGDLELNDKFTIDDVNKLAEATTDFTNVSELRQWIGYTARDMMTLGTDLSRKITKNWMKK